MILYAIQDVNTKRYILNPAIPVPKLFKSFVAANRRAKINQEVVAVNLQFMSYLDEKGKFIDNQPKNDPELHELHGMIK